MCDFFHFAIALDSQIILTDDPASTSFPFLPKCPGGALSDNLISLDFIGVSCFRGKKIYDTYKYLDNVVYLCGVCIVRQLYLTFKLFDCTENVRFVGRNISRELSPQNFSGGINTFCRIIQRPD